MQNTVQHIDAAQGEIQVSLAKKDKGAELSVKDNGPGINEANLKHIHALYGDYMSAMEDKERRLYRREGG
jgi:signal transduction histidine kinase